MCWYAYGEPYVPHETMIERMIGSTSSASNVHGVLDDNSNPYRTMVMDTMRMNQGHVNQYSIVDEEPNTNTARFFDLLKYFDEPLWDGYANHSKLLVVAHMFTIKSYYGLSENGYGLSEAGYDKIIE